MSTFRAKVMLDSAALIPAVALGSEALGLLEPFAEGRVDGYLCPQVLEETRRNLDSKLPAARPLLEEILTMIPWEIIETTPEENIRAEKCVDKKDAPVLAAAMKARVDYLVTLDYKHLLLARVMECSRVQIIPPQEFQHLYTVPAARTT